MTPALLALGSTNPAKRRGVEAALTRAYADRPPSVRCFDVPSGVAAQPWGDEATRQGAQARAQGALDAVTGDPEALGIGIEGGVTRYGGDLWSFSWVVVVGRDGRRGAARSGAFTLPTALAELVEAGVELGDACDRVFGRVDSKRREGAVGLLTAGALTRQELYAQATLLALAPWLRSGLYAG